MLANMLFSLLDMAWSPHGCNDHKYISQEILGVNVLTTLKSIWKHRCKDTVKSSYIEHSRETKIGLIKRRLIMSER